jgi:hypothetical protein
MKFKKKILKKLRKKVSLQNNQQQLSNLIRMSIKKSPRANEGVETRVTEKSAVKCE